MRLLEFYTIIKTKSIFYSLSSKNEEEIDILACIRPEEGREFAHFRPIQFVRSSQQATHGPIEA
jgi:hypothetical protein